MRISWDEYFLEVAETIARRSTCPRASVGAIIVKDNKIVSHGYNGSPRGLPHCEDDGCVLVNNHCGLVVHAEANALIFATGSDITSGALYCTMRPCLSCSLLIVNANLSRVVYRGEYMDDRILQTPYATQDDLLRAAGIEVVQIRGN